MIFFLNRYFCPHLYLVALTEVLRRHARDIEAPGILREKYYRKNEKYHLPGDGDQGRQQTEAHQRAHAHRPSHNTPADRI